MAARNIRVLNLSRDRIRLGSTFIAPAKNNPTPTTVDLNKGDVRRDFSRFGHRLAVVGGFTTGIVENMMPAMAVTDLTTPLTTSKIRFTPLRLAAGQVVSTLAFTSGATAAGTPTNQWAGIWEDDGSGNLVMKAVSADLLAAAWAANTQKTFTLASAYTADAAKVVYVGVMVKATTTPTLVGSVVATANALPGVPKNGNEGTATRTTPPVVGAGPATLVQSDVTNDTKVPFVLAQ